MTSDGKGLAKFVLQRKIGRTIFLNFHTIVKAVSLSNVLGAWMILQKRIDIT